MIRTKDLEGFMRETRLESISSLDHKGQEYCHEIVGRLRAYDKLKESIENLLAPKSSEVDK